MTDEELMRLLKAAFLAGFNVSGEGWNGEYPFSDRGRNPEDDDDFRDARLNALTVIFDGAVRA